MNEELFIFTPVYNRVQKTNKLYRSLLTQTCYDFIWLIVDDGSTDGLDRFVQEIERGCPFKLVYIRQENGGKHTAYNTALNYMGKEGYHICVDSDDFLAPNAVSILRTEIFEISGCKDYIGVVSPRIMATQNSSDWFENQVEKVDIPEIKFSYNLSIETAILIRNEIAHTFRFKVFPGEKFLSEEPMYIALAKLGSFLPSTSAFYHAEYFEDGLTTNLFTNWLRNPLGTEYMLIQRYEYVKCKLRGTNRFCEMIKCCANLCALKLKKQESVLNLPFNKVLIGLSMPVALILLNKRFSMG